MVEPNEKKHINKVNVYLKYSGLAFQLAFVIFVGIYLGKYIDTYFGWKVPIATMVLVLLLFGAYMYKLVIDLMKPK